MIAYRDFAPRMISPPGFLKQAQFDSFDAAVAAANEWILQNRITVIPVETVVLPNVWHPHERGTADPSLAASGEFSTDWHQFVRVWYELEPVPLQPA